VCLIDILLIVKKFRNDSFIIHGVIKKDFSLILKIFLNCARSEPRDALKNNSYAI